MSSPSLATHCGVLLQDLFASYMHDPLSSKPLMSLSPGSFFVLQACRFVMSSSSERLMVTGSLISLLPSSHFIPALLNLHHFYISYSCSLFPILLCIGLPISHILPFLICIRNITSDLLQFWMRYFNDKESWTPKHWCFQIVVLEKTHENRLDCKEFKPAAAAAAAAAKLLQSCLTLCNPIDRSPPGSSVPGILQARTLEWGGQTSQSQRKSTWIFIGRTGAEVLILWPPAAKSWLIGKDPDTGKDWRQKEMGATEDEMVGWYHLFNIHEFEQTLGDGERQGGLACCSPGSVWSYLFYINPICFL